MCFSLQWLKEFFIWIAVVIACVMIIKFLIPIVLAKIGQLGEFGTFIVGVVRILLWLAVAILCIVIAFDLVACLLGASGGIHFPRVR